MQCVSLAYAEILDARVRPKAKSKAQPTGGSLQVDLFKTYFQISV